MVLGNGIEVFQISDTRLSLSLATYSEMFSYLQYSHISRPTTPSESEGLGSSAFARRYLRNLVCISFPHLTEMFQFRWCPTHHYMRSTSESKVYKVLKSIKFLALWTLWTFHFLTTLCYALL